MKKNLIFMSLSTSLLVAFVSCSKEQEEPIDKTETPVENIDKYDYIFPDLTQEVDNDWLEKGEVVIYNKEFDDFLAKYGITAWDPDELGLNDPDPYSHFRLMDPHNSERHSREMIFGGGKDVKNCRIVAGWIKGNCTQNEIKVLEITPTQELRIEEFDADAVVSDTGIKFSCGSFSDYGNYKVGLYLVGFVDGKEARGLIEFEVVKYFSNFSPQMEAIPYFIESGDEGFSIETTYIQTKIPAFGKAELQVPQQGGIVTLALERPGYVKPNHINRIHRLEKTLVNGIYTYSLPELFLENFALDSTDGKITLRMLPNTKSETNTFDIVMTQYNHPDFVIAGYCGFGIKIIQAGKE